MTLPKTKPDVVRDPSDIQCPGYRNMNTPWWDGSQVYGSDETVTMSLRSKRDDGMLELTDEGHYLPRDAQGNVVTGFSNNWWIGMELMHTLFAREHNALCLMFKKAYPHWTG